jgi:acid-sensing ion channel, other
VTAVAQVCDPEIFSDIDPKNETNCDNCSKILLRLMGKVDSIFKFCEHTQLDNHCSEMFKAVITEDGVCYTYNGLDIYRNDTPRTEDWTLENGYRKDTGRTDVFPRAGSMYSLIVLLRVYKTFNDGVCKGLINGFRIYLHLPNEVPQISKHYFMMPYQQLVRLSISPRMITTARELREFSVDKRQCFFSDERYLRFFKHYTQSNCELECLANMTVTKCGCLRFNMPRKLRTNPGNTYKIIVIF